MLILGATGELGNEIVGALLAAGSPVIAVTPDGDDPVPTALPRTGNNALVHLRGHTRTETAGAALANAVRLLRRPPAAVVAVAVGSFKPGRLIDHPADCLRARLDDEFFPQLIAARHLLPVLSEHGACGPYLLIGGPAAEEPWAGYGQASVNSAAMRMLARVLHEETLSGPVRVRQLAVNVPIRTAENAHAACPGWPEPAELANRVVELITKSGHEPVIRFDRRTRT